MGNEFLEWWISKHFHLGPVCDCAPSRSCQVDLDTFYKYSPVPLRVQAHIPGETWNLDHLATVLILASELITEKCYIIWLAPYHPGNPCHCLHN